jgi:hypothetical protein
MPFWGKWEAFCRDLDKFRGQAQSLRRSERGAGLSIAANVPLRVATGAEQYATDKQYATDTAQPLEQIVETLRAYREAGLETVIWNIQSNDLDDYLEQMRLAAEQVMPAVWGEAEI